MNLPPLRESLGSLRNDDGGGALDNVGYKNELIFYQRILRYSKVI